MDIHNLPRLAQDARLSLTSPQKDLLIEIMRFHIEARYPTYKVEVRKIATKKFTEHKVKQIREMFKCLKAQIKS